MNVLVTLKPEHYEVSHHAFGVLAEIDWTQKRVIRTLRIPSASFRCGEAFMGPLTGGVCHIGKRVFVAFWNFILEVDYDRFEIVNAVSSPWMADLHGIATDGHYLWVTSTAIEALLCLSAESLETLWRWGPDEKILAYGIPSTWMRWLGRLRKQRVPPSPQARFQEKNEYRHLHKGRSMWHRHHLNDVTWYEGKLYLDTKGWFDGGSSSVICLDPESRQADFFVQPGGFKGMHDGEFVGGRFYVTESEGNSVAWREPDGTICSRSVQPAPRFIRGLCYTGQSFLIGSTRLRRTHDSTEIIEYDMNFENILGQMDLGFFYPMEQGAAIHALARSPGG
ncbi:MAG: hypothetical protein H7832_03080 [Magnetococcus sp. DMHC-6]